jgi:hypothetical protein
MKGSLYFQSVLRHCIGAFTYNCPLTAKTDNFFIGRRGNFTGHTPDWQGCHFVFPPEEK